MLEVRYERRAGEILPNVMQQLETMPKRDWANLSKDILVMAQWFAGDYMRRRPETAKKIHLPVMRLQRFVEPLPSRRLYRVIALDVDNCEAFLKQKTVEAGPKQFQSWTASVHGALSFYAEVGQHHGGGKDFFMLQKTMPAESQILSYDQFADILTTAFEFLIKQVQPTKWTEDEFATYPHGKSVWRAMDMAAPGGYLSSQQEVLCYIPDRNVKVDKIHQIACQDEESPVWHGRGRDFETWADEHFPEDVGRPW